MSLGEGETYGLMVGSGFWRQIGMLGFGVGVGGGVGVSFGRGFGVDGGSVGNGWGGTRGSGKRGSPEVESA